MILVGQAGVAIPGEARYSRRVGIVGANPEDDRFSNDQDAHDSPAGRLAALDGLDLGQIGDGVRTRPCRVIESSVESQRLACRADPQ
jgi:hypothetical protein